MINKLSHNADCYRVLDDPPEKVTKKGLNQRFCDLHERILTIWNETRDSSTKTHTRTIDEFRSIVILSHDVTIWMDQHPDDKDIKVLTWMKKSLIETLTQEIIKCNSYCETIFNMLGSRDGLRKELIIAINNNFDIAPLLLKNHQAYVQFHDTRYLEELALALCRTKRGQILLSVLLDRPCFTKNVKKRIFEASIEWSSEGLSIVAKNIHKYDIDDEELLKRAALKIFDRCAGIYALFENLDKFGYTDRKFLFTLTERLISENRTNVLCRYIQKFGFDEKTRIDYAFRLAHDPDGACALGNNFGNFEISDETIRWNLALLIYQNGKSKFSFDGSTILISKFPEFQITDEARRKELADKYFTDDRINSLIHNIDKLDLPEESRRKILDEIRRIGGYQRYGIPLLESLHQFAINDHEYMFRLISEIWDSDCISSNMNAYIAIAKNIHRYAISDTKRRDLFIRLIRTDLDKKRAGGPYACISRHNFERSVRHALKRKSFKDLNLYLEVVVEAAGSAKYECAAMSLTQKTRYKRFFEYAHHLYKANKMDNRKLLSILPSPLLCRSIPRGEVEHIHQCAKEIVNMDHSELRTNLCTWFYCALLKITLLIKDNDLLNAILHSRIMRLIYKVRDTKLRQVLFQMFWVQLHNVPTGERISFVKQLVSPPHAAAPKILLAELDRKYPMDQQGDINIHQLLPTRRFLRDGGKSVILLKFLYHLLNSSEIDSSQLSHLIQYFKRQPYKKLEQELLISNLFFDIKRIDLIVVDSADSESQNQLQQSLIVLFNEILPHVKIENSEKLDQYFFRGRRPEALPLYMMKMQMLDVENKSMAFSSLLSYMHEVVNEVFYENRYKGSVHLDTLFCGREELMSEWKRGEEDLLKNFLNKSTTEEKFNHKEFMINAAENGHFPLHICPKFAKVMDLRPKKKGTPNNSLDELLVSLFENSTFSESLINEIERELNLYQTKYEFLNDLNVFRDELKPKPKQSTKGLKIVDTDHYWDLFLCGTEVAGSCQRVDGNPYYNRALLGYVMDGKYRMIVIKDPKSGQIIGRAILRLILSEKREPLLFFEQIYPENLKDEFKGAMIEFAKNRATKLGIQLVSNGPLVAYGESVGTGYSLDSRAHWEYVDALRSQKMGTYEIPDCRSFRVGPTLDK